MKRIITVGREFGSGGRELGKRLADHLGYAYYDYEIISEIAKRTSLSENYIQHIIEQRPAVHFPITVARSFAIADNYWMEKNIQLYQQQEEIIKEMAKTSPCVIVGRCADFVLRDQKPFRIFVYAEIESKMKRCYEKVPKDKALSEKQMQKNIAQIDKNRSQYYEFYTNQIWGDKRNYDLCLNMTNICIKEIIPIIAQFIG